MWFSPVYTSDNARAPFLLFQAIAFHMLAGSGEAGEGHRQVVPEIFQLMSHTEIDGFI